MRAAGKDSEVSPGAPAEVVDLFCGAGGLSHGFVREGFRVLAGYDLDQACRFPFERNNNAEFIEADVARLTASDVSSWFTGDRPTVLAGCAPCQPFSTYRQGRSDPRWELVQTFANLAAEIQADYVTMENVPRLLHVDNGAIFDELRRTLRAAGYHVTWRVADAVHYGVPQRRRRLVVIAARNRAVFLPRPSHDSPLSVRDAIADCPSINAGGVDSCDPLHTSSRLSDTNLRRIRASRPGGTWRDWPAVLRAPCHRRGRGRGYGAVYGRMRWDEPAPTITTLCHNFGSGRFGHPEQDRAISLREAAILQSFPPDYAFVPQGTAVAVKSIGRWIGNAVPVELARAIARAIADDTREIP